MVIAGIIRVSLIQTLHNTDILEEVLIFRRESNH